MIVEHWRDGELFELLDTCSWSVRADNGSLMIVLPIGTFIEGVGDDEFRLKAADLRRRLKNNSHAEK